MLKVEDKFFHGVSFADWEFVPDNLTHLDLLEMVLKDGYIFSRNSLRNKHIDIYTSLYNHSYNGLDKVSISCHPLRYDRYTEYLSNYFNRRIDDAFDGFVSNYFSIILKEDLLENYSFYKGGCFGEYQIYGDISLKDMVGLGVPNFFQRMCDEVMLILKKENFYSYRNDYYVEKLRWSTNMEDFLEHGYCKIGYYEYERAKELLSKYNYDVILVDPETGLEWSSMEEMKKRIESVRELAKAKRLIKN